MIYIYILTRPLTCYKVQTQSNNAETLKHLGETNELGIT